MPDVMDEFEIDVPAPPEAPLRQGEERYAASLNLQDRMQRESLVKELFAQWNAMKETTNGGIRKFSDSKSARKRQKQMLAKVDELRKLTIKRGDRYEGPCAPFTVVNLNPVGLEVFISGTAYRVPAAGKGLKVELSYNGRKFMGSYVTFETPCVWFATGGTQHDISSGLDTPSMDVNYTPPAGIAYQFYAHYVRGASDAQGMGGILVFEGNIHTLDAKRLECNNGNFWIPRQELTLEGQGEAVYTVEEVGLKDTLSAELLAQRNFASGKISEGHTFATSNSDIMRNQLNRSDHVVWHNYALGKAYIEKALPWATETLKDSPSTVVVSCPNCTTRQENPDQQMCKECNTYFDPFKSFMAGKAVPPDQLLHYAEDSEEWAAIVGETMRRKNRMAMLTGDAPLPTVAAPPEQRPLFGAAKAAAEAKAAREAAASAGSTEPGAGS